jgi:dienelactone hydrolase
VYGIFSFPQAAGRYPGILMLHGGGSNAEDLAGLTVGYAQRGYAALAIDLPGICGTSNHSSGPWKSRPAGEAPRFDMSGGGGNSTLVDAETAGLEAFHWLKAQAKVDSQAMGITGFSWGGYSTTFLSGVLGDEVKAAYSVFGCGFYEKGSYWKTILAGLSAADRDAWLAAFDAGRRAPGMKAAYFLEAETKDAYFWPEAVSATLGVIPGAKNHAWGPNLNHQQMPSGPAMQARWFDYHLKGAGAGFATVRIASEQAQADGTRKVGVEISAPAGVAIDSVRVWYSVAGSAWSERTWIPVPAAGSGAAWNAVLPASLASKEIDFFPLATDARLVATAGEMRHAGLSGPAPLMRGPVPSVNTSPSGGGGGRRILYRSRDARGRSASWAR